MKNRLAVMAVGVLLTAAAGAYLRWSLAPVHVAFEAGRRVEVIHARAAAER